MSRPVQIVCDGCGKTKQESNHWWREESMSIKPIRLLPNEPQTVKPKRKRQPKYIDMKAWHEEGCKLWGRARYEAKLRELEARDAR